MEKLTLMDLIEKFNSSARGKTDFSSGGERRQTGDEGREGRTAQGFVKPDLTAPPQYIMNTKMRDFVLRHDAMSKAIDTAAKSAQAKKVEKAEVKSEVLSAQAKKSKKPEINKAAKSAKTKATTEEIKSDVLSEKAKKTKKTEINKAAKSEKTRKKRAEKPDFAAAENPTLPQKRRGRPKKTNL